MGKIIAIGLLIGISTMSWIRVADGHARLRSAIALDGDSSDTIIISQERFRGRVFFDILKKMNFIPGGNQNTQVDFQPVKSVQVSFLFVNRYLRNVFYVYAFFTVP